MLAVSLLASGCGGGDDSSSNATTASNAASNAAEGEQGSEAPKGEKDGELPEGAIPPSELEKNRPEVPESSPKGKFIAKANTICGRRLEEGLEAIVAEVSKADPRNRLDARRVQAETLHTAFLPVIQEMIQELEELEAPPGDEEEIGALIEAMQAGFDESMETEYTAHSVVRFGQEEFSQSAQLARQYGVDSCVIS